MHRSIIINCPLCSGEGCIACDEGDREIYITRQNGVLKIECPDPDRPIGNKWVADYHGGSDIAHVVNRLQSVGWISGREAEQTQQWIRNEEEE